MALEWTRHPVETCLLDFPGRHDAFANGCAVLFRAIMRQVRERNRSHFDMQVDPVEHRARNMV